MSVFRWSSAGAFLLCAALCMMTNPGRAEAVNVGDVGPLFQTMDENMQPVDMAALIVDRPLVIVVGSAS